MPDSMFSGEVSASAVVVSGKISTEVKRNIASKLNANFFNTVVRTSEQKEFNPIPPISELQALVAGLRQTSEKVDNNQLARKDATAAVTQTLVGVPIEMCTGTLSHWDVTDSLTQQKEWKAPTSVKVEQGTADAQDVPVCVFTFGIQNSTTTPKSFTANPQLNLNYRGKLFSFNLMPITFTANDFPRFASRVRFDPNGKDKVENGLQVREFNVVLPIEQSHTTDGPNNAVWTNVPIKATCSNETTIDLLPAPSSQAFAVNPRDVTNASVALQFDLNDAGGALDGADLSPLTCTLSSGQLRFQDESGTILLDIPASLGLHITLPHVKPDLEKLVLQAPVGGKLSIAATVRNITKPELLKGASFSQFDGSTELGNGTVNGLNVTFPPVALDPASAHQLHYESTATSVLSAAKSDTTTVPASQPTVQPR